MNTNLPTLNRQGRSLAERAVTGLGFARHPMVSRAGNRFTLLDSAGNERPMITMDQQGRIYIDVVIFDTSPHPNRIYFSSPYDQSSNTPPDCFSDNGTGPSTFARNPQAKTCTPDPTGQNGCKWAVWGSRVTQQGSEIPACQVGKKLAVLVVSDDSGLHYEFRVPPGSFGGQPTNDPQEGPWLWYIKSLKGYGCELFDVVTRISFVPNTVGQMVFKPVAKIESIEGVVVRVNDAWNRNVSEELVGLKDTPIDPARFGQRVAQMQPSPQTTLPPPPTGNGGIAYMPGPQGGEASAAPPAPKKRGPKPKAPETPAPQHAPFLPQQPEFQRGVGQQAPFLPPQQNAAAQYPAQQVATQTTSPLVPAQEEPPIPAFLRREQPAPVTQPAQHGVVMNPPAPNADLQQKLDQAFKLPGH